MADHTPADTRTYRAWLVGFWSNSKRGYVALCWVCNLYTTYTPVKRRRYRKFLREHRRCGFQGD